MSSKRTPARAISSAVSSVAHNKRDGGDWKSTMEFFREEVRRLKEEGDSLRSTNTDLTLLLQKVSGKMELLSEENHLSHRVLLTVLDEERQKVVNAEKEKEELLQKLKETEERCALQQVEISRLAGVLEEEQAKNSSIFMRQEKLALEKDAKFQLELNFLEKRLEEMQCNLRQRVEEHEATLVAKDRLVEEEKLRWEKQETAHKEEIFRLLHQIRKREHTHLQSTELETEEADLQLEVNNLPSLPVAVPRVADETVTRNTPKKSRLEVARQQRRVFERHRENVTLTSLTKLNDLQESLHI